MAAAVAEDEHGIRHQMLETKLVHTTRAEDESQSACTEIQVIGATTRSYALNWCPREGSRLPLCMSNGGAELVGHL